MRRALAIPFVLTLISCSPGGPTPDPSQTIHVVNGSPVAVMVAVGSLLGERRTTAARPCGGEVTLQVDPGDYTSDGRLMAFVMTDPTGAFDVALQTHEGDPLQMSGTFPGSLIWSDGALAGRLPVYLAVTPEVTVTVAASPVGPSQVACTPRY